MTAPVQTSARPALSLERTRDVAWLDSILRQPEIYEGQRTDDSPAREDATLADVLQRNPGAFCLKLLCDDIAAGFALLLPRATGLYEIHTNILREQRGANAVHLGKFARDWMFLYTDAYKLFSHCPEWCPEAKLFAHCCGFREEFTSPAKFIRDGKTQFAKVVTLNACEWVREVHPRFRPLGEHFHAQLEAQLPEPNHPEDPAHDSMVGLCLRMGLRGQPDKAQMIYNDWAATAAYAPVKYLGRSGGRLLLDIGTAVVAVDQDINVQILNLNSNQ